MRFFLVLFSLTLAAAAPSSPPPFPKGDFQVTAHMLVGTDTADVSTLSMISFTNLDTQKQQLNAVSTQDNLWNETEVMMYFHAIGTSVGPDDGIVTVTPLNIETSHCNLTSFGDGLGPDAASLDRSQFKFAGVEKVLGLPMNRFEYRYSGDDEVSNMTLWTDARSGRDVFLSVTNDTFFNILARTFYPVLITTVRPLAPLSLKARFPSAVCGPAPPPPSPPMVSKSLSSAAPCPGFPKVPRYTFSWTRTSTTKNDAPVLFAGDTYIETKNSGSAIARFRQDWSSQAAFGPVLAMLFSAASASNRTSVLAQVDIDARTLTCGAPPPSLASPVVVGHDWSLFTFKGTATMAGANVNLWGYSDSTSKMSLMTDVKTNLPVLFKTTTADQEEETTVFSNFNAFDDTEIFEMGNWAKCE